MTKAGQVILRLIYEIKWFLDLTFRALVYLQFALSRKHEQGWVVIVSTDGMGDVLLRTHFIRMISAHYANHAVCHFVREEWVELSRLLVPDIVHFPFDQERYRRSYMYRWAFWKRSPVWQAHMVAYPVFSRSSVGDEIVGLIEAENKVTFSGDDLCMSEERRRRNLPLYDHIVDCSPLLEESQKYRLFLAALGIPQAEYQLYPPIKSVLNERGPAPRNITGGREDSYILVFPKSSNPLKEWPESKWVQCCDRLYQDYGHTIILSGSQSDEGSLRKIQKNLSHPAEIVTGAGWLDLLFLIDRAQGVLSVDSGPAHLAIALKKHTVVLIAGGQFGRHFPQQIDGLENVYRRVDCYECNWRCPFPEPHCITGVQIEAVLESFDKLKTSVEKKQ